MIPTGKELNTGLGVLQSYNLSKLVRQAWNCFAIPAYESQPVQDAIQNVKAQAVAAVTNKVAQQAAEILDAAHLNHPAPANAEGLDLAARVRANQAQLLSLANGAGTAALDFARLQAKEWLSADGLKTLLESMGLVGSNADLTEVISLETEEAQRELLKRVAKLPEAIAPPTIEFDAAVNEKLTVISNLAFKMALTQLILPDQFHKIYREAEEKSKVGGDLDTAFLKALDDAFRTRKTTPSAKERLLYWIHINISSKVIRFYIDGVMENFKKDLFAYLRKKPDERVDDVFKIALGPLKEHMSAFHSFNQSLVNTPLPTTIHNVNKQKLNEKLPIDTYISQFAEMLIDRYLPLISISEITKTILDQYIPTSSALPLSVFQRVTTAAKVGIVWTTYLMTRPIDWILNTAAKYIANKKLKSEIKLHLFTSENGAAKTHSRYQHIINQSIRDKLIQFNTRELGADQAPLKLQSSPTRLEEMEGIVDELFRNIPLSIATNTPEALNKHFKGGIIQEVKQEAYTLFINKLTPDMSLELLKGIEHFLYDDKEDGKQLGLLSEVIWVTANNLIKAMKTDPGTISAADMNTTETDMHDQLHRAVNSAVRKGVRTALDPSKKLQNETTATIDSLRKQSEAFLESIKKIDEHNFSSTKNEWETLIKAVSDLEKQFQKSKAGKIQNVGRSLLQNFTRITSALQNSINSIEKHQKTKAELEGHLDVLKTIGEQINTASAAEKIHKLRILGDKPWIAEDFRKKIKNYQDYLGDFLKTSPTTDVIRLHKNRSDEFAADFTLETSRLEKAVTDEESSMQKIFETLDLEEFKEWTKKLAPIEITSEDVTNTLATVIKVTNVPVDQYAAPAVMYCVLELLNFKQKSYHWNGVLSRAMHAYTVS